MQNCRLHLGTFALIYTTRTQNTQESVRNEARLTTREQITKNFVCHADWRPYSEASMKDFKERHEQISMLDNSSWQQGRL